MMIGHQQAGPDQEAGRVTDQIGARILELDAADRTRRQHALGQIVDAVEIIALDDPFQSDLDRLDVVGLLQQLPLPHLLLFRRQLERAVAQLLVQSGR